MGKTFQWASVIAVILAALGLWLGYVGFQTISGDYEEVKQLRGIDWTLDPFAFQNQCGYIDYDEEFHQFENVGYPFNYMTEDGQLIDDAEKYPFLKEVLRWTESSDGSSVGYDGYDGSREIPAIYDEVDTDGFHGEYATVRFDKHSWGIIDRNNNIVKRSNQYAFTYLNGTLYTAADQNSGTLKVFDVVTKEVFFETDLYRSLAYTGEGYCGELGEEDWVPLDKNFQEISDRLHLMRPLEYYEGIAASQRTDGTYAYIDEKCDPIVTLGKESMRLCRFSEGRAFVYLPYKVICYDRDGRETFTKRCDIGSLDLSEGSLEVCYFTDGIAPLLADRVSYGIVDMDGTCIVKPFLNRAVITDNHRAIINYKGFIGIAKTDSGRLNVR